MTRKEEVKEAAQKYVGFIGAEDKVNLIDAFKIGVEWAVSNKERIWHSVSDRDLPQASDSYLSKPIIAMNKEGEIYLCVYDTSCGDWMAKVDAVDYDYIVNDDIDITYWCEIPQFENIMDSKTI